MTIYQIQNQKISSLKEKEFPKEKEMHDLIEANLDELFGLQLIDGEFQIEGYFLDSLAYDPETNSFVILEYKKSSNFSVVDQGLHYLSLMLNNKANFVLAYITKTGKKATVTDFDWSQVRVIFVAKSFTQYQHGATNFKDFPIELWEFNRYENGLLDVKQIQSSKKAESITKVIKNNSASEIISQVKTYTVQDHLLKSSEKIQDLFMTLQREIFEIDDRVQEKPVGGYVGYKIRYKNFCSIHFFKDKLKIYVRVNKIDDPKKVFKQILIKYKWGKIPLWFWEINDEKDIDYAMTVIRQGYEIAPDK